MAPLQDPGPVWIDCLLTVKDNSGHEWLVAHYVCMKGLDAMTEHGLIIFNDDTQQFDRLVQFNKKDRPCGPPSRAVHVGDYFYFVAPFATMRVKATLADLKNQDSYESLSADQTVTDVDSRKPVKLQSGSINWNTYRKKWILIAVQKYGESSYLGEVWYSEADNVTGPWRWAKKILTHNRYGFYNPKHHPFFDQENGRLIYFEGTYSERYEKRSLPTPRYDYNQIMYRLDLADPRLHLPQP